MSSSPSEQKNREFLDFGKGQKRYGQKFFDSAEWAKKLKDNSNANTEGEIKPVYSEPAIIAETPPSPIVA
ncbi:hypothetical protein TVAG_354250 [Trichomonas vaginalis G3]|uniref:Uncharacterized protein n=1 Tax=Trichomonas vaginalis (strain ATCC PRA-98 / G3) TaxID=412133 RepID=A2F9B5_TRIV3|nr:hypothetical protein TVAGG3_0664150 [Trichomonas vaginalis G3]EAX98487.1 hypothetical protein TVAG_354250 [Trichomonas vaginalis G3]KAI5506717.1 hypothetical protein TVAGG3_0664150 [Trichomonas vaginalis G3]|eukprot:XP_001311417.1 hypothetical protein [Trichomonas vaginalis G3]